MFAERAACFFNGVAGRNCTLGRSLPYATKKCADERKDQARRLVREGFPLPSILESFSFAMG